MDWRFVWNANDASHGNHPLSSEVSERLSSIERAARTVKEAGGANEAAWVALAKALKNGRELEIPDYKLEECSGLRGQFMLDLLEGNVEISNLAERFRQNSTTA